MALINCPQCQRRCGRVLCHRRRRMGVHALGGNAQDPNLVELLNNWFGRKGGGA